LEDLSYGPSSLSDRYRAPHRSKNYKKRRPRIDSDTSIPQCVRILASIDYTSSKSPGTPRALARDCRLMPNFVRHRVLGPPTTTRLANHHHFWQGNLLSGNHHCVDTRGTLISPRKSNSGHVTPTFHVDRLSLIRLRLVGGSCLFQCRAVWCMVRTPHLRDFCEGIGE